MRPSARFLRLAMIAFALSTLAATTLHASAHFIVAIWAFLAAALAADVAFSRPKGALSVAVDAPKEAFAGESAMLRLQVADAQGRAPAGLRARLAYPEGLDGPAEAEFDVAREGGASLALPLTSTRRGAWLIDRLWLLWPGRWGLVEFTPSLPLDLTVSVAPNIRPITSGQIDMMVRSALFGVKENALQGEGSEFHQLRDFTQGMDVRAIDWKRSASRRTLLAKEMRAERNHHVMLALDCGHLMREEIAGLPKLDHQIHGALAVAWAAVQGGDQIGMLSFDSRPRAFLPPSPGRAAFARMRSAMADIAHCSTDSNFTLAGAQLQTRLKRRSLIVIFSDFVDTTTAELLLENVAVLNRRHLIVFATLGDPALRRLAERARPDSLSDVARAVAADQFQRERRAVLERLARMGVLCVEADPGEMTGKLIATYLRIKTQEMI